MPSYIALPFPTFQPALRLISSITNSNPVEITTTFAHQYVSGTIVRLFIPAANGMTQLNQFFGPITVTAANEFTMNIDTTAFDPYIAAGSAQVIPMGEVASILTAAKQNVLPY